MLLLTSPTFWFLPSGYVKIATEHGPVEIVDLPINSMVIFHINHNFPMVFPWFSHGFPKAGPPDSSEGLALRWAQSQGRPVDVPMAHGDFRRDPFFGEVPEKWRVFMWF